MAVRNLIVLNNPDHWTFDLDEVEVVSARDYLSDSRYASIKNARVFNLCRSYRYQSVGYYVSLLAAARDHRAIPTVTTMQDFKSQTIIRTIAEDIDALVQKTFSDVPQKEFVLHVYFGQTVRPVDRFVGRALYNLFQAPLLKVNFVFSGKWLIQQIVPISIAQIPAGDREHICDFARSYFSRKRFPKSRIQQYAYDLAILINPDEPNPPSCRKALKKFVEAADKLNVYTEFITKADYSRLSEFDALFIRETTLVNHHTYRFSRKAHAEGLVVIDDPWSILRCANKVYLAERLAQAGLPAPRTVILQKESPKNTPAEMGISFPCVLKQPDSAFSQGVVKAGNETEFYEKLTGLLEKSDLIIAQEFMQSEFDWRIGILDRKPLYACRYYMARGHWQIYNWSGAHSRRFGKSDCLPVEEAPADVVQTALKAANLIGDGFYGVDLKQIDGRVVVIEVNDNPSIDAGVEDVVLKGALYDAVIRSVIRRIEGVKIECH
ncbi:RimK family protein [Tichowtungia aerotolerans]|uniref:ATP-grasp domain-containing protein n=1 Tax=Tichowtungia aerotolerans TaxID=2697043 RepID=A0A6P1M496_9BACT|nr:RimK family protein [Tichowtungia aerotolerans]QHI68657.1 ATP-grasp domain-containing protein [Tichowtungia aerotolerans]